MGISRAMISNQEGLLPAFRKKDLFVYEGSDVVCGLMIDLLKKYIIIIFLLLLLLLLFMLLLQQ